MQLSLSTFFSALAVILSVSCGVLEDNKYLSDSGRATSDRLQHPLENKANEIRIPDAPVSFEDRTEEVVSHAEKLIKRNQEEGAVLDQRWYGLKYFAKHQELIFNARKVIFFGGLEKDVRDQFGDRYAAIEPAEENQDSGDIRQYLGKRKDGGYDYVIIGQNGKEVALKTMIRLLYLAKFAADQSKKQYRNRLDAFFQSLQVLMSSMSPRQEFVAFFHKYGISKPDAVFIGFRGDVRALLKDDGIGDPESYTDESLRVNWYPDARGRKVLLVSIDENRIFASRSGGMVEALFAISAGNPPAIIFLGAAGAINEPDRVGKLAIPVSVMDGDPIPDSRDKGALIHMIRNRAADNKSIKTADASVESVVVETTAWVKKMKSQRVDTVDQELLHVVRAINSSVFAHKVDFFAGHIVTDNVSSNAQDTDATLVHAEETIVATADLRKEFFSKVLTTLGILELNTRSLPRRSQSSVMQRAGLAYR